MTTDVASSVSVEAELKSRFDIDGFVNYGRILEPNELQVLSTRIDAICDGTVDIHPECTIRFHKEMNWGPGTSVRRRDAVWQLLRFHKHDHMIRNICKKALVHRLCELFLGGPVQLMGSQVILKPAHHGGELPWHQDSSYWGSAERITCWVAIDEATPANGCMRMIPGSHRRGQLSFTPMDIQGAPSELLVADDVNEDTQVYVPVRDGCASFHHCRTLHKSEQNTTPHRRRAIAVIYERAVP